MHSKQSDRSTVRHVSANTSRITKPRRASHGSAVAAAAPQGVARRGPGRPPMYTNEQDRTEARRRSKRESEARRRARARAHQETDLFNMTYDVSCTVHDLMANSALWIGASALEIKCNVHDDNDTTNVYQCIDTLLRRDWSRFGSPARPCRMPSHVRWSVNAMLETTEHLEAIGRCAHLCALAAHGPQPETQQAKQTDWADVWQSLLLAQTARLIVPRVQLMPSNLYLTVPSTAKLDVVLPCIRELLRSDVLQHVGKVSLELQALFDDGQCNVLEAVLQEISHAMEDDASVCDLCQQRLRIHLEVHNMDPTPLPPRTDALVEELHFSTSSYYDKDQRVYIDDVLKDIVQSCADDEQPSRLRRLSLSIDPSDVYYQENHAQFIPDALSYAQFQTDELFSSGLLSELPDLRSLRVDFDNCSQDSQDALEQMIREEIGFVERNHRCIKWAEDEEDQIDELEKLQNDAIEMQEDDACRVVIYTDNDARAVHNMLCKLQDYSLRGMLLFDTQTRRVLPSSNRHTAL